MKCDTFFRRFISKIKFGSIPIWLGTVQFQRLWRNQFLAIRLKYQQTCQSCKKREWFSSMRCTSINKSFFPPRFNLFYGYQRHMMEPVSRSKVTEEESQLPFRARRGTSQCETSVCKPNGYSTWCAKRGSNICHVGFPLSVCFTSERHWGTQRTSEMVRNMAGFRVRCWQHHPKRLAFWKGGSLNDLNFFLDAAVLDWAERAREWDRYRRSSSRPDRIPNPTRRNQIPILLSVPTQEYAREPTWISSDTFLDWRIHHQERYFIGHFLNFVR